MQRGSLAPWPSPAEERPSAATRRPAVRKTRPPVAARRARVARRGKRRARGGGGGRGGGAGGGGGAAGRGGGRGWYGYGWLGRRRAWRFERSIRVGRSRRQCDGRWFVFDQLRQYGASMLRVELRQSQQRHFQLRSL